MPKLNLPKDKAGIIELLMKAKPVLDALVALWRWGRSKAYWDKTNGPGGFDGGMHGPTK